MELVSDHLDDRLPLPVRRRVDAHLASCPGCAAHASQIRATVRACRSLTGR